MTIIVRLFASLRDRAGVSEWSVELPEGARVSDLQQVLVSQFPQIATRLPLARVAVNDAYAVVEAPLHHGDCVVLIPPVSGARMFEIWDKPLDPRMIEAAVIDSGKGAVVTFAGIVRDNSQEKTVSYLEYEAYRPLAEQAFREIGEEVKQRWGLPCAIVHRVGRLEIGEASVIIAVAAPHRGDAFDACEYAIDRLKHTAPIWKKEVTPSGDWWVEGDTVQPVGGGR